MLRIRGIITGVLDSPTGTNVPKYMGLFQLKIHWLSSHLNSCQSLDILQAGIVLVLERGLFVCYFRWGVEGKVRCGLL